MADCNGGIKNDALDEPRPGQSNFVSKVCLCETGALTLAPLDTQL